MPLYLRDKNPVPEKCFECFDNRSCMWFRSKEFTVLLDVCVQSCLKLSEQRV